MLNYSHKNVNDFIKSANKIAYEINKGGVIVPDTLAARDKIITYLEENSISIGDLAVLYGIHKQDMADYLGGRKTTPKGNKTIIRIIADFKIR